MRVILLFLVIGVTMFGCSFSSYEQDSFVRRVLNGESLDKIFGDFGEIQEIYGVTEIGREKHKEYLCYRQKDSSIIVIFYRTISDINGVAIENSYKDEYPAKNCANLKIEEFNGIADVISWIGLSQSEILSKSKIQYIESSLSSFEIRANRKIEIKNSEFDQYTTVKFNFLEEKLIALEVWQTITN